MARTRKPARREGSRRRREGSRRRRESGPEITGVVLLESDGSGRLLPDEFERSSLFLPSEEAEGLRPGDRITVRLQMRGRGRPRARVVARHARRLGGVAGILRQGPRGAHVHLPSEAIRVTDVAAARDGEAVVVEVEQEGRSGAGRRPKLARGRVTAVLGDPATARVQAELLIHARGWPMEFSALAESEAAAMAEPRLEGGRHDLRTVPHVTIDGASARDFDDAVAAAPDGDGFRVWVSIADVAHYVGAGSAVDREARERGTSVYFPHRALPMLPERLSSDLCCLRPDRERYAVTCEMQLTADGEIAAAEIYPTLIRSRARLTYEQVQAFIDGTAPVSCAESVGVLVHAARALRARRGARGALDLDIPEAEVILSKRDEPTTVEPRARLESHRLIEDLMVAANETVAAYLLAHRAPAVFRVHEPPDPQRVNRFATWAQSIGVAVEPHRATAPRELARTAAALRRRPQAAVGQALLLRAMAQARYDRQNLGHFALASDAYLHFTSPIRRYPDLLVHRCLWGLWRGERGPARLGEEAAHASAQERRAVEAERALVQLAACQVARRHLGEIFPALVTGVHRVGAFVRTRTPMLEGLVPMEALAAEPLDLLDEEMTLVARRSGRTITVGDEIEVQLVAADTTRRTIDFTLPGQPGRRLPARRRRPHRRSKKRQ
jgi:ribonuclease R